MQLRGILLQESEAQRYLNYLKRGDQRIWLAQRTGCSVSDIISYDIIEPYGDFIQMKVAFADPKGALFHFIQKHRKENCSVVTHWTEDGMVLKCANCGELGLIRKDTWDRDRIPPMEFLKKDREASNVL